MVRTMRTVPGSGSGASVRRPQARRAFIITSPILRSASGSRSQTTTSWPIRAQRAAHPAPMTPPPRRPTVLTCCMPPHHCMFVAAYRRSLLWRRALLSAPLLQLKLCAHLIGSNNADVHCPQDRHGALDQRTVGREDPLGKVDVVLQPNPDIAARKGRHGDEG